jgi:NADH:ubiquinone oxidoreductase subunit 6 (subunit J)
MDKKPSWFARFFNSEFSESSKRLILITLVFVFIIQVFLLMYIKVEIANKDLVKSGQYYLVLLIAIFGGFVSMEVISSLFQKKAELQANVDIEKAKSGTPETNVNVQNVENVKTDNLNVQTEKQPL